MYKKTLLSVAIASTLTLTGCLDSEVKNESNASDPSGPTVEAAGGVYPVFELLQSELPIPNDLIFDQEAGDGSFSVSDTSPPVTTALNRLSGASTVAPIDIAMSGYIDETTLAGNVVLLALDYASGSALQGLGISEPPTILPASQPSYDVSEIELDGTSFIRITPTTPLNPATRYLVVITKGVTDLAGDPIIRSPGVAGYEALSDVDQDLASPALAQPKALINGLWEPLAQKALSIEDESSIALSYSFTTSGDEKVLNYLADPAQWFNDQILTFMGVSTATSVVTNQTDVDTNGEVEYTDISLALNAALAVFPVNASDPSDTTISDALAPLEAAFGLFTDFDGNACAGVTAGTDYIECISAALAGLPSGSGGFADLLPTPAATTVTFDDANALDINQVSSLTASLGIPLGTVSVVEGTLTLPYYLGVPSGTNGLPLITDSWEADDALATAINETFEPLGLSLPQADPAVSTVVNYIFPFPKKTTDVTIPILGIHPTTPAGLMKPVIYQHGVTLDRSAALAYGGSVVAGAKGVGTDVAFIAIDQPLHGIDGISPEEQAVLAETLATSGGVLTTPDLTFDGIDADEQATIDAIVAGLFSAGIVQGVDAATNSGAPGATMCVDLATNGLTATTTSILGGACDADPVVDAAIGQDASVAVFGAQVLERTIANGASQIPGLGQGSDSERHFGFTSGGAGAAPVAMDYSGSGTTNTSGNMFINLTSFITSRDNGRQASLDLMALRKSVGTMDLNGGGADLDATEAYYVGQSLGTLIGIPFVAVANDSSTTTDDITAAIMQVPGGGGSRLLENSPLFGPTAVGGLAALGITQDTSSFQAYMNVFQAALDAADPINFAADYADGALDIPVLFAEVVGDQVIPNSLDEESEVLGDGSTSPLSGTEPLAVESEATDLIAAGTTALEQNIVRFVEGTHGTAVFPSTGTTEEQAAFAEMVAQGVSIIVSGGTGITITDDTVIKTTAGL